jgi:hypothetical protein
MKNVDLADACSQIHRGLIIAFDFPKYQLN